MKHSLKQRWLDIVFSVERSKGIACSLTFFSDTQYLAFKSDLNFFSSTQIHLKLSFSGCSGRNMRRCWNVSMYNWKDRIKFEEMCKLKRRQEKNYLTKGYFKQTGLGWKGSIKLCHSELLSNSSFWDYSYLYAQIELVLNKQFGKAPFLIFISVL